MLSFFPFYSTFLINTVIEKKRMADCARMLLNLKLSPARLSRAFGNSRDSQRILNETSVFSGEAPQLIPPFGFRYPSPSG